MPTEFEAEREQLATIYDMRLAILEKIQEGKKDFTAEEILAFFDEMAKSKKKHK